MVSDYLSSNGRERIAYRKAVTTLTEKLGERKEQLASLSPENPAILVERKIDRDGVGPLRQKVAVSKDEDGAIFITAYQNNMACVEGRHSHYYVCRASLCQLEIQGGKINGILAGEAFRHEDGRHREAEDYLNIKEMPSLQPEISPVDNIKDATAVINQIAGFLH